MNLWLFSIASLLRFLFIGALGIFVIVIGTWLYMQPLLPKLENLDNKSLEIPLRIYSGDNRLIGEFGEKRRIPVAYEDVPQDLIHSFLAAEDSGFFSHNGVDLKGIIRAALELVASGSIRSGGSTITMQVARNFLLTKDRTLVRKVKEILLALQIEQELDKETILELYVNKIFLGKRAYGAEAAARVYYGKTLSELNLAQYAMIAGLPKAPSAYNPLANPDRAIIRRNWILRRLHSLGYIDKARYEDAVNDPITAVQHSTLIELDAPHVAERARQLVVDRLYGLAAYNKGYKVYTTIRSDWQQQAQKSVSNGIFDYDLRHGWRGTNNRIDAIGTSMHLTVADHHQEWVADVSGFPDLSFTIRSDIENENSKSSKDSKTAYITVKPSTQSYAVRLKTKKPSKRKKDSALEPVDTLLATAVLDKAQRADWIKQIAMQKKYKHLTAAAVVTIAWREAKLLLADGTVVVLNWEQGLSDARKYITESYRGSKPQSTFQILDLGDIVYLRDRGSDFSLSQVPEIKAALITLDPTTGAIRSMVSGFDFETDKYNYVTQGSRQPGSGIKPFIYVAALEKGFTAASIFNDAPLTFDDDLLEEVWRPSNAGDVFRGPTRIREALYRSINLVSIRILREIGTGTALRSLKRFGFDTTNMEPDLSLVLGSQSVTPLEMARGYAVFANGGYLVNPYIIERVETADGEVVYSAKPKRVPDKACPYQTAEACSAYNVLIHGIKGFSGKESAIAPRVLDERLHYIMDDILRDVVRRGTARRARVLKRADIAGKTGTTNGPTDLWFNGYNPSVVTSVWMGFADNRLIGKREYASSSALPIWVDFMRPVLENRPVQPRNQPNNLAVLRIDPTTGERALPSQEYDELEIFRSELAPKNKTGAATEETFINNQDLSDSEYERQTVDELF